MHQTLNLQDINTQHVETVVRGIFPGQDTQVERVLSGISTYVYRIVAGCQIYYLRILPEKEGSFAPELAVLAQLRQSDVNVPDVIYFEDHNELLGRPVMIETEIKGLALSRSTLSPKEFEQIAVEAGRDLARINTLTVEGFGWVTSSRDRFAHLYAKWPTFRAFALEYRMSDLAYLRRHILNPQNSEALERVLIRYDAWLDMEQGYLAHGDFDSTHIFQDQGRYTGIIDFGEVRSAGRCYDLAHFRIRDGAHPPYRLFPALERGYNEVTHLPSTYEPSLRFTSVLINMRALVRAFQTRSPDQYIWQQLKTLHEDLAVLA